jgi:hypothetical protein
MRGEFCVTGIVLNVFLVRDYFIHVAIRKRTIDQTMFRGRSRL